MEQQVNGGIRIFVKGVGGDLASLLPAHAKDAVATSDAVSDNFGSTELTIRFEESDGVADWLEELAKEGSATALAEFDPDIVITSIEPEIDSLGEPESEHVQLWMEQATRTIGAVKEKTGANVFWLNTSTVDTSEHVFNYHGLPREPRSLRVQRLSLALVGLSHELGISVIDVDRVLAERGVDNVEDPAARTSVIRSEVFRVLEDYGYFDDRPIAVQVGQQKKGDS